jgi:hypothetical protein
VLGLLLLLGLQWRFVDLLYDHRHRCRHRHHHRQLQLLRLTRNQLEMGSEEVLVSYHHLHRGNTAVAVVVSYAL